MQITLGLLGQTYLLSIQRGWISDVNFWKCLSRFCKLRTASPSLAAVCRQSSGCRLPLLYRMLHWSVMSMYIGNCSLCVRWEEKTCRRNPASADSPAKEEGNGCFWILCTCCAGQALGFGVRHFSTAGTDWGSRARERHVWTEDNSSSEQDSHEHWAIGCIIMTSYYL